jgi:hypothetical protein
MIKVTAYRNTDRHCFCQIKFKSRERVLVSVASVPEPGIKVIQMLLGIIPLRTIWEFTAAGEDAHDKMIDMFTDQGSTRADHPLDAVIIKLRSCRSCREAVRALSEAEKRFRGAEKAAL